MRIRLVMSAACLLLASSAGAQSFLDSQVRFGPQFASYSISAPINEKISQVAFPFFVAIPIFAGFTVDVGTAYALTSYERRGLDSTNATTVTSSELNGLTDTQVRGTFSIGQDLLVLTAGINLPTGSATVTPEEIAAATVIGSDFLSFPVSGFGSGMGMTGGFALARPLGSWNWGLAASMRYAGEYEPFQDATGVATKFQPGPEYRLRTGVDHPFGTGSVAFGVTYSKFGDDKANATSYTSGDRYIGTFSMSSSFRNGTNYSLVLWNLFRSEGELIGGGTMPGSNITNAALGFGVRGPADISFEPTLETRIRTGGGLGTSVLGSVGARAVVNRGGWAVVPGFGFSMGTMESATLTGFRASLAARLGR